ncbi:MAG TPA: hypothetical protein PKA16_00095 [Ottowia sp.]|uniref:hypothetical protein n=1 Tax=Ottowia sp. TaxID=1898956 RepID=UPI002C3D7C39|nr:hypothetical protein [Ottowia sp.]HMN19772.1 hypothetical protein [Ottowia sp.]
MEAPEAPSLFEREHQRLEAQLHAHLLEVVAGDFGRAQQLLELWRAGLARHIEIEEERLLPQVPAGARWQARVYRLEHQRIVELADEYAGRVAALARRTHADGLARREAALRLLDAAHALRHLLEHHHQREEMALAHELPIALQQAAWGAADDAAAPAPE